MNLNTKYLGLDLCSPLVVGANPLTEKVDALRAMEKAGAGAVVLLSLFEEQLTLSPAQLNELLGKGTGGHARAQVAMSEGGHQQLGPSRYLELIRRAKDAVSIPVIASLNGSPQRSWKDYAQLVEQAGADAIELNLYYVPTDPRLDPQTLEGHYYEAVASVRREVNIPVAVKLSPFFSNLAYSAAQFEKAGADGLVLFNRFYQPDLDLEHRQLKPQLSLSNSEDSRLPLRWIGLLRGGLQASLSATTGVHNAHDALKLIAAGADTVQLCSVILKHGVDQIHVIKRGMEAWLNAHETTLDDLRGSLSQAHVGDPSVYERAQYMRTLDSYSDSTK